MADRLVQADQSRADGGQRPRAMGIRMNLLALPWLLVAFSPVIVALLTWDPAGVDDPVQRWVRLFGAPYLGAELILIVYAVRRGFSPWRVLAQAPLPVQLALGGLVVIALADAALVAPRPVLAAYFSLSWIVHALFGLSADFLVGEGASRRQIWQAVLAGIVCYAILLVLFVCSVDRPADFDWRYFGLGVQHIRHAAFFAAVGLATAIGLSCADLGSRRSFAYFGIAALMFAIIFWSGSRNSIVGVIAAFLAGLAILPSMRRASLIFRFAAAGALGLILSLLHHPPSAYFGLARMNESVQQSTLDSVTTGRLGLWRETWNEAMARPLFGHGEAQLLAFVHWTGIKPHPHNVLLQAVFSWGLVGLACFLWLAAFLLYRTGRGLRQNELDKIPPFLVGTTLVLMSFNDGTLFFAYPCMMVALSLGCSALSCGVDGLPSEQLGLEVKS